MWQVSRVSGRAGPQTLVGKYTVGLSSSVMLFFGRTIWLDGVHACSRLQSVLFVVRTAWEFRQRELEGLLQMQMQMRSS